MPIRDSSTDRDRRWHLVTHGTVGTFDKIPRSLPVIEKKSAFQRISSEHEPRPSISGHYRFVKTGRGASRDYGKTRPSIRWPPGGGSWSAPTAVGPWTAASTHCRDNRSAYSRCRVWVSWSGRRSRRKRPWCRSARCLSSDRNIG